MLVEPARRRRRCRWGRTSASATRPRATPTCCAARTRSSRAVVPLVEVDGEIVSSTHIRGLVVAGDLEQANRFLGSPFQLRGTGPARRRARARRSATRPPTSSPTTRSSTRATASTPAARRSRTDGEWRWWPAATNVGVRPTFVTGRGVLVEAYLLDFDGRPLRPRAAARVPRAAARASGASTPSRRWWSRCTATCEDARGDRGLSAGGQAVHPSGRALATESRGITRHDREDRRRAFRPRRAARAPHPARATPAHDVARGRERGGGARPPAALDAPERGAGRAPLRARRRQLAARRAQGRPGRLRAPRRGRRADDELAVARAPRTACAAAPRTC